MSLLTFERPTCGQVIGSTMTRLWLRFYAGSRRINEPAYHDERWWLWISIITSIPFVFIATHYCSKQHYFHDTSIVFFLSGGDSTENAHMHTLARTQHTTHHSSKSISGFFFYYCLFCLCFGILYYYYYYHHYSTVQVTLFVLFQFRFVMLSIILLFFVAFIGYPGVKNSRFTKQRPIITKSIPLYGVQKQKTTEYPISPRTTQSAPMHFV